MANAAERHTPRFYWPVVALIAIVAAGIFYLRLPLLTSLRALAFDAYQHASPAPPTPDSPIRVVQIDEESLAHLGQWPWSRTTIAQLTQRLGDDGAAAIAFDILFSEADRTSPEQILATAPAARRDAVMRALGVGMASNDARFADTLAHYPTILAASLHNEATSQEYPMHAGLATAGDDPKLFLNGYPGVAISLPVLSDAAHGVGFINWLPDGDQVVRRVPLLLRHNDDIIPSLSLESLRVAVGASTYVVRSANANGVSAFGAHTGVSDIRVGPITIPTDAQGQFWLHFRPYNPQEDIPAWRVLSGATPPGYFRGTIVLIGASAPGLMDLRATPLDSSIPGVEVHRQLLEQVLSGHFLTRPDFAPGIELTLSLIAILILALAAPRFGPSVNAGVGIAIILVLWGLGLFLFVKAGYLFDPVYPSLAALVFGAGSSTYFYQRTEHQRAGIRRAFSQYVAPDVVRQLTAHPERLKLGGEVRELTVFLCDIRNFSTIAERLNAEELTAFINSFLTPLTDIIIESGGTIDKYMGDAIMAFWNAPIDQPDHALRAGRASLQIVEKMRELNDGWRREAEAAGRQFEDVRIGIGINSGECCVGNLGSERRFDYSAIGDAVNIASRLEGLTKIYGVPLLVSEDVVKQAGDITFIEADLVRVKGRQGATRVFTAISEDAPASHTAFLDAYRQGRFGDAAALLSELQANAPAPLRGLYASYAQRLGVLSAAAPANWDGVYDPDRK